ncbi:hypothetical protein IC229_14505 [Spirosoma sp. BT702]|uniref:Uncharacterized protein n=1 Tax=Spirosoma profusum TaxID=2771354 RepID=A0A926XW83_9BACT|nr:hypothetical protein [Spirosoma profusum]MBD2701858.1 hypothetical protein [Spirosoma profusum]
MLYINQLRTLKQYESLSEKQLLQRIYAGQLYQTQLVTQILLILFTLLNAVAKLLLGREKQELLDTDLSPEPLPAIQRKIEETQQELEEDLQKGVYDAGL